MTALYSSVLTADSQYFDLVDCSALYGVTKLRVTVDRGSARVYCGARPDALVELQDCSVGVTDIRLPMLPYVGVARLSGNSSSIKIEVLGPEVSELPLTSAYSTPVDGISTDFALASTTQQATAQASARISFDDSTPLAFSETFDNLAAWSLGAHPLQVSGGAAYAGATRGSGSGANRSYALAAGENLRAVFIVNIVTGGGSGGLGVGVSKDAAGAVPTAGGGNAFALYFPAAGTTPQTLTNGAFANLTGQPAFATGQYIVTLTVDQTYISIVAVRVSNGEEIRCRLLRSGFAVNNIYLFNSDARQLTGHSCARIGARKAVASLLPLATYEAVQEKAHWSGNGTHNFKLHIPKGYDSRKPLNLVIAFHGHGSDENHWATNSNGKVVKDALVAAGYAVLGCAYAANTQTWGAQVSLDAYVAAYNWARSLYPIGSVAFYANSMGGIESLLSLAERRIPGVVAWVGTSPTTNLADNYTGGGGQFTSAINSAYGIAGGATPNLAAFATATKGHDPMLMTGAAFRGVPMLFLAASDDVVVSKAANTDAFATKFFGSNAITVQPGITGGHSFSFTPYTAQIVAFINAAVRP